METRLVLVSCLLLHAGLAEQQGVPTVSIENEELLTSPRRIARESPMQVHNKPPDFNDASNSAKTHGDKINNQSDRNYKTVHEGTENSTRTTKMSENLVTLPVTMVSESSQGPLKMLSDLKYRSSWKQQTDSADEFKNIPADFWFRENRKYVTFRTWNIPTKSNHIPRRKSIETNNRNHDVTITAKNESNNLITGTNVTNYNKVSQNNKKAEYEENLVYQNMNALNRWIYNQRSDNGSASNQTKAPNEVTLQDVKKTNLVLACLASACLGCFLCSLCLCCLQVFVLKCD